MYNDIIQIIKKIKLYKKGFNWLGAASYFYHRIRGRWEWALSY